MRVLELFALDGFAPYRDTFGPQVSEAMLVRLHRRCRAAVAPHGRAHRLHDDRFAVGGRVTGATVAAALTALSERGAGFAIVGVPAVDLLGSNGRPAVPSRDTLVRDLEHARPELARHMRAVAALARGTGRELGLSGERLDELVRAAELHDVGKVAVPDAILDKHGPLADDEAAFLRTHTVVGERILATAAPLGEAAELVRCSHERWDGFGYPDGRRAEDIPLGARVIAVCDAYETMVSERHYSAALEPAAALAELRRSAGRQFDPRVVEAFVVAHGRRGDTGEPRVLPWTA
ncbi:MAG TPA: HD domain-containing phosphohydrolase [Solirubrobacteraceae bacterium]|jgi:HD-GYP domain-containing protein (c-di-GMP phosphodiesterase class II)|nr:HD domain-containing phosphohydrolase [Solirubrobacteraceae bacterium]